MDPYWRHFHHRLLVLIALLAVAIGLGVVEPCDTEDFTVQPDIYCRPKISNTKYCCEAVEEIFSVSMQSDLSCLCSLESVKFGRLGSGLDGLVDFYTMCGGPSPRAAQLIAEVCKLRGKEPEASSSERLHGTRRHLSQQHVVSVQDTEDIPAGAALSSTPSLA